MKMTVHNGVLGRCKWEFVTLLLSWGLLLCAPGFCAAADISGHIKNRMGWSLPGVTVTLVGPSYSASASTGYYGNYAITGIPDGDYIVKPSYPAYPDHIFNPDTVAITVEGSSIFMKSPYGPDRANFANFDPSSVDFVGGIYECSAPDYDYDFWNEPLDHLVNNTCYNYAANVLSDTGFTALPGAAAGYDTNAAVLQYGFWYPCRAYLEGAIADGLEYVGSDSTCSNGKSPVALFVNRIAGFHWYRLDSDGTWSEKNETNPPNKATDSSGAPVTDIRDVERLYPIFCGHFCVCSDSAPGQGHEYITSLDYD